MPAKAKEEKGCVSNKEKGEKEKKPPMPTHLRVTKYWTQKWVVITAPFLLSLYPNELPSSLSLQLSHSSSPPLFLCSCKIQRTQIQGMPTNIYSLTLFFSLTHLHQTPHTHMGDANSFSCSIFSSLLIYVLYGVFDLLVRDFQWKFQYLGVVAGGFHVPLHMYMYNLYMVVFSTQWWMFFNFGFGLFFFGCVIWNLKSWYLHMVIWYESLLWVTDGIWGFFCLNLKWKRKVV